MLDNLFYKTDKNGKKKKMNDQERLGVILIGIIVIMLLVFIAFKFTKSLTNTVEEKTVTLSERFSLLKENYTLNVIKTLNGETSSFTVDCDKDVCMYSSSLLPSGQIIGYKDKWYMVSNLENLDKSELKETNNQIIIDNFNSVYYNFELIKSIIEVSNRESTDASTITANVTLIRFLKEYNYIYGTTFKTDKEITIPVKLVLSSTMVSSIEIDYKDIDNFLNGTNYDDYKYLIEIKSVNANNFDSVRQFFEQ